MRALTTMILLLAVGCGGVAPTPTAEATGEAKYCPPNGCVTPPPCTCPSVANASSYCSENVCHHSCNAGWGNCNDDWSDGCEANLNSDAFHCGSCGTSCAGLCAGASFWCSSGYCEVQPQDRCCDPIAGQPGYYNCYPCCK
jgi:hypothetical protein